MRVLTILIAIMIFVSGCATRTVVIKSHPTDSAPQAIKDSKATVSDNHLDQGKHLYFKGNYNQATKHFIRSIANNRENWEAYYYLGLTQQKSNRFDRAIGSLNNSLKFAPDDPLVRSDINYALGISWEAEGYFLKADEKFKAAWKLNPKNPQTRAAIERVKNKTLQAQSREKNQKGKKAF